jgi:MFS family permease
MVTAAKPAGGAAAWFAVMVLCLAQVVSTVDRGMLALVIDPLRADLQISELQIALLQGFAFAVFYVSVGLPLGLLADFVNRRRLLVGGVIIWSAATIGGGLARDFGEMFASRLCIGIGEAVLAPCAVTMIGDLFPVDRRGRPMAVYVLGTMVAYGFGSVISGYILNAAPRGVFDVIAPLRGLAPWRIAFILVGSFGVVLTGLLLLLREPSRQESGAAQPIGQRLRASLRYFSDYRSLFLPLYGSLALFALGGAAVSGWGAVLLTRSFGFKPGSAGQSLGSGQILWALAGALVASVLVDRVSRHSGAAGKIRLTAALAVVAIPAALAAGAGQGSVAAILLSELMFASAIYGATMLSVISEVTPIRSRGIAVALYSFVMAIIGASLGPLAVAFLTERVFGTPSAVGASIAIVGTGGLLASAALSLFSARQLKRAGARGGILADLLAVQPATHP